jgi:catechol 2,3-dioxygenase
MSSMSRLPHDASIAEVTLAVSDLARSVAFYSDVIGFAVHEQAGSQAALGPAGGPVLVRLTEEPGARPRSRRTSGLYHVAILTPSRAALGRSLRRLTAQRWSLTGASDHRVSEALYLDDPDGLGLEIYRDRPGDRWTTEGDEIVMATEPLDLDAVAREPGADEPWAGLDAATRVGHVHLHVPDLEAAERLYCDEIGFTPTLRSYPGALFVAAGGYHHHVGLNIWAGRGARPPAPDAVGLRAFTITASALAQRVVRDASTGIDIVCVPR